MLAQLVSNKRISPVLTPFFLRRSSLHSEGLDSRSAAKNEEKMGPELD